MFRPMKPVPMAGAVRALAGRARGAVEAAQHWWTLPPVWTALVTMAMVTVVTIVAMGLYSLYQARVELTVLEVQVRRMALERVQQDEIIRKQLDSLYRTLYNPPEIEKAPEPRKPTYVELWQQNRDKELRERILRLEQWRYRVDRQ